MSAPNRRAFLLASAGLLGAGGVAAGLYAFRDRLFGGRPETVGYGRLAPVADQTTGLPLLLLPEGFTYISFGWTKDPLDDGTPTPPLHDGMAVVRQEGTRVTLVRNHERSGRAEPFGSEAARFDARAPGGCSNVVFDLATGQVLRSWLSLAGTATNCAGGATPWGTWLSCEETVAGRATIDPKDKKPVGYREEHGWVFEVPAEKPATLQRPKPLVGLGRFVHEAVCIDPTTNIVYLTEDSNPSGVYRFKPTVPGELAKGGALEMLAVADKPDLRKGVPARAEYPVRWVPIEDPARLHTPGKTDGKGVFTQGAAQGGTAFARLEGIFWSGGRIPITATSGGDAEQGQVWEYTPGEEKLRLLFESPSAEVLNMPDNLSLSPKGCVVLCEDGGRRGQRMHGLTPEGKLFTFAENGMQLAGQKNGFKGDFRDQEWAGVSFSPDGKWLFANLQTPGLTVAITGPWEKGPF